MVRVAQRALDPRLYSVLTDLLDNVSSDVEEEALLRIYEVARYLDDKDLEKTTLNRLVDFAFATNQIALLDRFYNDITLEMIEDKAKSIETVDVFRWAYDRVASEIEGSDERVMEELGGQKILNKALRESNDPLIAEIAANHHFKLKKLNLNEVGDSLEILLTNGQDQISQEDLQKLFIRAAQAGLYEVAEEIYANTIDRDLDQPTLEMLKSLLDYKQKGLPQRAFDLALGIIGSMDLFNKDVLDDAIDYIMDLETHGAPTYPSHRTLRELQSEIIRQGYAK